MPFTTWKSPSTVYSDSTSIGGGGMIYAWTNPSNAITDDSLNSIVALGPNDVSQALVATDFDFSIPVDAIIQGVEFKNSHYQDGTGEIVYDKLLLAKDGTAHSPDQTDSTSWTPAIWPYSKTDTFYGGSSNSWGVSLSRADVLDTTFGVAISCREQNSFDSTAFVNQMQLRVFYVVSVSETTSGGSTVGGSSLSSVSNDIGGGIDIGGIANPNLIYTINGNGGGNVAGRVFFQSDEVPDGGVTCSGTSFVRHVNEETSLGGVSIDGTSFENIAKLVSVEGGSTLNGNAYHEMIFNALPIGGIKLQGLADVFFVDEIDGTGGIESSGEAFVQNYYYPEGGLSLQGESDVLISVDASGGSLAGGQVVPFGVINEPPNGILIGSLRAGGESPRGNLRAKRIQGSGQVVLGSNFKAQTPSIKYNASGRVLVSSSGDAGGTNLKFTKTLDFLWNLRTYIIKDLTFLWSTGRLNIFFYRVIGKDISQTKCPIVQEPCCKKFILNIHARTLAELCEKLSARRFVFPIDSVQRFTRPAENSVVRQLEEAGENVDCNDLVPVEICDIPACADFCVDYDLRVEFNFDITNVQVDSFIRYTSGNNVAENTKVFLTGKSDVSLVRFIPNFSHDPIGSINISGDSEFSTNSFVGKGGSIVGGEARSAMTKWSYVGGKWPSVSPTKLALNSSSMKIESLDSNNSDVAWQLTERALTSDGLYTQSDVSFSKTSEFLFLKDFKLGIPSNSKILGASILIDRVSTQIGIRDLDVRLMLGDKDVSGNMAKKTIDWPLIETSTSYSITDQSKIDTIDAQDFNDPLFGLAIRVKNVGGLGSAIARIDYASVSVIYETIDKQTIKTSGQANVASSAFSYVSNFETTLSSNSSIHVSRKYKPNGIGNSQPTTFVIGGGHAISLSYESNPYTLEWVDDELPIDLGMVVQTSKWGSSSVDQNRADFGFSALSSTSWSHPQRAAIADVNFSILDFGSGISNNSSFLVVRGFKFNVPDHSTIIGVRAIIANRIPYKGVAVVGPTVRDSRVYLVRGNTIISDNLADLSPWTPGTKIYGSTGLDGKPQFRDTNNSPWLNEEINDDEFGVAIEITTDQIINGTQAWIDGIAVEILFEAFSKVQKNVSQPKIGGFAAAFPNFVNFFGGGGLIGGGQSLVKPYWDVFNGGVSVAIPELTILQSVNRIDRQIMNQSGQGGVSLNGSANAPEGVFAFVPIGSIQIGGNARSKTTDYSWKSDGNAIFIGGGADQRPSDFDIAIEEIEFSMVVLQTSATFLEDRDVQNINVPSGLVDQCGCMQLPLTIAISHNIAKNNLLSQFLVKNNLSISRILPLRYNTTNNSWQNNIHYNGISPNSNKREQWDIIFELKCTEDLGGINIGRSIWKFAIQLFRKNLETFEDYDTRIIVGIMPERICGTLSNELNFKITYDTQLDFALVSPDAVIYQSNIFDNIGLFKNRAWIDSPELVFNLSQAGIDTPQARINLTDSVLVKG